MALAYSNTFKPLSASALANAKAKGIGSNLSVATGQVKNTQPPASQRTNLGAGISLAPLTITSKGASGGQVMQGPQPQQAAPKVASTGSMPAQTGTMNYSPSGGTSGVTGLLASLQSQLTQKQGELANAKAREAADKEAAKEAKRMEKEAANKPSYTGLIGDLSSLAKGGSPGVQAANEALVNFRKNAANYRADIYGAPSSARVMQGRDAQVQLANAQTDSALASGVANALTGQGQQLTALQGAATLAAPQLGAYGQAYYDPLNPGAGGGAGGAGNLNPVAAIPSYAQQVAGGGMSYDQAVSALGNNPAFVAALNAQVRQINPNFSAVQSNANASVQGSTLQQTAQQSNALQLASQNAYKALDLLSTSYNGLGGLQKTPIPLVNKGANLISSNLGLNASNTQAYQTAIQEARAAVSQVLSAVGNTPTYSESTAKAIIPDNAGPDQIASAIRTVEQLIQQKVQSFSQPGIAPQFGGGTNGSGGLFDW